MIERAFVLTISTGLVIHVNAPYAVMVTEAHISVPLGSTRVRPAVAVPKPVPVTLRRVPPALPDLGLMDKRLGVTATVVMVS